MDSCAKSGCDKPSKKIKKCSACEKFFHNACGEFSSYKDKTKPDVLVHLCSSCSEAPSLPATLTLRYQHRSNSTSSQSSAKRKALEMGDSDDSDSDEPDLRTILKAIKESSRDTRDTKQMITDLATTMNNFSSSLNLRCDGIESTVQSLQGKMSDLKKSHAKEIEQMKEKYDELEFRTKTEVFIHGYEVADIPNLEISAAVLHIAEFLDVPMSHRDIQRSRIIRRKKPSTASYAAAATPSRPSIIAVEFFSHAVALQLVNGKRNYGKLLNKDLSEDSQSQGPISISFPLNKEQHSLLQLTKARAALHNFKYVWNSRGFVFIRQADGAPAIKIVNSNHLDVVLPQLPQISPSATHHAMPMDIAEPLNK